MVQDFQVIGNCLLGVTLTPEIPSLFKRGDFMVMHELPLLSKREGALGMSVSQPSG